MKGFVKTLAVLAVAALAFGGCQMRKDLDSLGERVDNIENELRKNLGEQITALKDAIAALGADDKVQTLDIDSLKDALSKLEEDFASAKTQLNSRLDDIESEISAIKDSIGALEARLDSLESKITLRFLPDYGDGSARVTFARQTLTVTPPQDFTLRFSVYPADADKKIKEGIEGGKISASVLFVHTATKATAGDIDTLSVTSVSTDEKTQGVLTVKVAAGKLGDGFMKGEDTGAVSLRLRGENVNIDSDYIPLKADVDALYKYLVENYDYDGDWALGTAELEAITSLNISGMSLTTVSDFLPLMPNIESLDCSKNALENLDVSVLTKLTSLNVSRNEKLSGLDLSANSALTVLNIDGAGLSSLKTPSKLDCLIGQSIICNGEKAVIFLVSATSAKIVSAREYKCQWADVEGKVSALGAGWSLASSADCGTMKESLSAINKTLYLIGGTEISGGSGDYYWNGSANDKDAWAYNFPTATSSAITKDSTAIVRAVRSL